MINAIAACGWHSRARTRRHPRATGRVADIPAPPSTEGGTQATHRGRFTIPHGPDGRGRVTPQEAAPATRVGTRPQTSSAYWRIVRCLEKRLIRAVFTIDVRVHSLASQ